MAKSNKEAAVGIVVGMILVIVAIFVIYALTAPPAKAASKGGVPTQEFRMSKSFFERVEFDATYGTIYFIHTEVWMGKAFAKNNVVLSPTKDKHGRKHLGIKIMMDKTLSAVAISAILQKKPYKDNKIQIAKRITVWVPTKKDKLLWRKLLNKHIPKMNPAKKPN